LVGALETTDLVIATQSGSLTIAFTTVAEIPADGDILVTLPAINVDDKTCDGIPDTAASVSVNGLILRVSLLVTLPLLVVLMAIGSLPKRLPVEVLLQITPFVLIAKRLLVPLLRQLPLPLITIQESSILLLSQVVILKD